MKHENVVELFDYTENDKEIVLLMEYCNDANYFEEKIEHVSKNIIIEIFISKYTLRLDYTIMTHFIWIFIEYTNW